MTLNIVKTSDNSDTLFNSNLNEHYHSTFGAVNESMHVFIHAGLHFCNSKSVHIFEMGFGTGLNTILTFTEGIKNNLKIKYTAIELYPVDLNIIKQLNYLNHIPQEYHNTYYELHQCEWNKHISISPDFLFRKINADFLNFTFTEKYNLVYYDAFAPGKQPALWSPEIFQKIYHGLNTGGVLTTYSSKGMVKKNLRNAGFIIKRLNGPSGKRHMLRAVKA